MSNPVRYVDRMTGEKVTESVMGDRALRFAYETLAGRTLWPVLFGSKLISAYMGRRYDSRSSRKDIAKLVAIPGCVAEEAEKPWTAYESFNEFFTRHLKPGARPVGEGLVSPADGRLRLYLNADADRPFPLKGATKSLREVFAPGADASQTLFDFEKTFDIAVIRLAPVDYHRFHFPCDSVVLGEVKVIPGKYHSVNPIALLRYPDVYADNERQIVECNSKYGHYWQVDVGAFGVGTIVQTFNEQVDDEFGDHVPDEDEAGRRMFKKGDERGYFKFGGSTVILVMKAGAVKWDEDLVRNSAAGLETRVLCNERIGI